MRSGEAHRAGAVARRATHTCFTARGHVNRASRRGAGNKLRPPSARPTHTYADVRRQRRARTLAGIGAGAVLFLRLCWGFELSVLLIWSTWNEVCAFDERRVGEKKMGGRGDGGGGQHTRPFAHPRPDEKGATHAVGRHTDTPTYTNTASRE